jgi:alpha-tubulin suppressor-like RCC1 family protein
MKKFFKVGIALVLLLALLIALLRPAPRNLKLPVGTGQPSISLGVTHGLVLASDGSLWSWGSDFLGWPVLGFEDLKNETCLRRIGDRADWVNIAAGESHNLAIRSDGTLWAWGANFRGQLGDGSSIRWQKTPVRLAAGTDWKQAAASGAFSVALKKDGTLWAWGDNWAGELGNGSAIASRVPVQVGSGTNWSRVWAGLTRVAGLQTDGSLWVWGSYPAPAGQVPNANKTLLVPARLSPDTNWVDVAFGPEVLLAIKSDGTLWASCFRAPIFTGVTNNDAGFEPVRIGTNSDWLACSSAEWARDLYVLLKKKDGSFWVMESSMAEGGLIRLGPVNLPGDYVAFAGGGGGGHGEDFIHDGVCTGVALTKDGGVWTWGRAMGHVAPSLQAIAGVARGLHYDAHWGDARTINRDTPWQLPNRGGGISTNRNR